MHRTNRLPNPAGHPAATPISTDALPSRRSLRASQEAERRASRRRSRPRASAAAAMSLVAGLAVTSTMPAFAVGNAAEPAVGGATASAASARPQSFVAAGVVQQSVTRDAFAAEAKPEVLVPTASLAAITVGADESTAAASGASGTWVLPIAGRISDGYGPRPDAPVAGVNLFHKGTDLAGACGTPVRAAAGGTVEEASSQGSYGNWILLDNGGGIETGYAHNSTLVVGVGDTVTAGEVIALRGSTGASTGCHLHFEMRVDGEAVDPVPFMSALGVPLG
ncbi:MULTISPECIES: M23 family metallopeptidase [unclassified Rathayibacter]|uniref:M23 family metallopeptidase n=1 Tax=unclassified Rathayibacter TaxID=2609250 RepID=UPI00188AD181|nr:MULTISPECIES: M23 family metallopeptidase [unclassified Rathayibacter]MBF4461167.1 M23 family metallopeptidase [Rathayibacter sp. VKM Ac-2879]MBF4502578.1 M23 family metallopeptidase [Rathayibacter sp. VKM Ac-2878]